MRLVGDTTRLSTVLSTLYIEQVVKPGLNLGKTSGKIDGAQIFLQSLARNPTTLMFELHTLRRFPMSKLPKVLCRLLRLLHQTEMLLQLLRVMELLYLLHLSWVHRWNEVTWLLR